MPRDLPDEPLVVDPSSRDARCVVCAPVSGLLIHDTGSRHFGDLFHGLLTNVLTGKRLR
jgi:hypothetical protein